MHSARGKLSYIRISASKMLLGRGLVCPSCANTRSTLVARKYALTALRRCSACHLLFRTPTTTKEENAAFYQRAYSQGLTSDVPSLTRLDALKTSAFRGTEIHYGRHIEVLAALGGRPGTRLFDYGCSWGYGSWQLVQAGYDVAAFEISVPRADYARVNLGIDVVTTEEATRGTYDIVFSSHVLEHVPSVATSLRLAKRLLRPGGLFVAFTPNGCDAYRVSNEYCWMKSWGQVHPNLLDDAYYGRAFEGHPLLLASGPYDCRAIERWATAITAKPVSLDLTGAELLAVARLGGRRQ